MSASFALPQIEDGLEKLLLIASLRKEDITATAEEARKQMQLTNEQLGKVAEAKSYITQHGTLAAALKGREDVLADNQVKHDLNVKQHATHVASENVRLETFSAQLEAKKKEQDKIDERQRAEAERVAGRSVDMEREHREAIAACQRQEANNTAAAQANAVENERLKTWETTLKDKAKKLREQAANF